MTVFLVNLSTVGQEDSSSEETPLNCNTKPAVPPRPRSIALVDHQPFVVPRRHPPSQKEKAKSNITTFSSTFLHNLMFVLFCLQLIGIVQLWNFLIKKMMLMQKQLKVSVMNFIYLR